MKIIDKYFRDYTAGLKLILLKRNKLCVNGEYFKMYNVTSTYRELYDSNNNDIYNIEKILYGDTSQLDKLDIRYDRNELFSIIFKEYHPSKCEYSRSNYIHIINLMVNKLAEYFTRYNNNTMGSNKRIITVKNCYDIRFVFDIWEITEDFVYFTSDNQDIIIFDVFDDADIASECVEYLKGMQDKYLNTRLDFTIDQLRDIHNTCPYCINKGIINPINLNID